MNQVRISVDGKEVTAEAGTTVAAAVMNTGASQFRTSVRGESRAPLCAMGICHECRVTIDGSAHRRSCLVEVRDGMRVDTGAPRNEPQAKASGVVTITADVVIVGAGPAGIAAAIHASEAGARVVMLDENARPGGQIWRHRDRSTLTPLAAKWIERFDRSKVSTLPGCSVSHVTRLNERFQIIGEQGTQSVLIDAGAVILATGARERFLPFPGSTLPNVVGVGGAQALLKSGLDVRGKRVVIAGSGPLLLPVAASMAAHGARLSLVAEQAPLSSVSRFARGLWRHPSALVQAAKYRSAFIGTRYATGSWVVAARGNGRVEEVDISNGHSTRTRKCDILCVAQGLVPNTELARQIGCDERDGVVVVDDSLRTTVANVYSAGELTGIGGMELALVEGTIAGLTAAGKPAKKQIRKLRKLRTMARAMNDAFALRDELRATAHADAIVCRCEDVTMGALEPGWTLRKAKLYTRAGMGACQGRVCGAALQFLHGGGADSVRLPVQPIRLTTLAACSTPAASHEHGD